MSNRWSTYYLYSLVNSLLLQHVTSPIVGCSLRLFVSLRLSPCFGSHVFYWQHSDSDFFQFKKQFKKQQTWPTLIVRTIVSASVGIHQTALLNSHLFRFGEQCNTCDAAAIARLSPSAGSHSINRDEGGGEETLCAMATLADTDIRNFAIYARLMMEIMLCGRDVSNESNVALGRVTSRLSFE